MILFNTFNHGDFILTKFEGNRDHITQGCYQSFAKAKKVVITGLKEQISELQAELVKTEAMEPDSADMHRNPFTGYLRSRDG